MSVDIEIKTGADVCGREFPDALDKSGFNAKFISEKMMEFATAKDNNQDPLYNVQLKGVDMALRIQGAYVDKLEVSAGAAQMQDKLENAIVERISNNKGE